MRSTLMPASAPARTISGGTGAPPQPKRVSDDTSRSEPLRGGDEIGEERGRGERVGAPLALDELDRAVGVPTVLQHELQPEVERQSDAEVEAGRVADRARCPHHVVGR